MKLKILLDTSVISAYFDERQPERMFLTRDFWKSIEDYQVYISEITLKEIGYITDKKLKANFLRVIKSFKTIKISNEVKKLAEIYISRGVIPKSYINDALQIATATTNNMDSILSWNFRHMVNRKVESQINAINIFYKYPTIDIATPAELL